MSLNDAPPSGKTVNKYVSKKTIAQGMFDVALLSSSASQLTQLINDKYSEPETKTSSFTTAGIVLLIISIILQVVVGICLIGVGMLNKSNPKQKSLSKTLNNVATVLIFFITILSVIIPSLHPHPSGYPSLHPSHLTHPTINATCR